MVSVTRADVEEFQSAPPTGVRGDGFLVAIARAIFVFQSAPPTGVRGDLVLPTPVAIDKVVSIRSPNRS